VALARARKTLRNLDWFEVKEIRGSLSEGQVNAYQVTLLVGFRLNEE
jgi:flavin-binding protein dodecin